MPRGKKEGFFDLAVLDRQPYQCAGFCRSYRWNDRRDDNKRGWLGNAVVIVSADWLAACWSRFAIHTGSFISFLRKESL